NFGEDDVLPAVASRPTEAPTEGVYKSRSDRCPRRANPKQHTNLKSTETPMSTPEQYDALIIGSGEAGKYLSWHLGSQGKKVANIEDKRLGGACPNVACLPSKNVIHSAKVASFFQ